MHASETLDFEREFRELVRELRALPAAAPQHVRERVGALGEPAAARRRWPVVPWRRALLVLAPVCMLALVAAAVVHGLLSSRAQQPVARETARQSRESDVGRARGVAGSALVPPAGGRHQDYDAWMTLRVRDLDALTVRTNEAMQIVRSYGGYVASVNQWTTAGSPGEADLVLRVPVAHVEDALIRLADLGTVLGRRVSIVDLEQALRRQRQRILRLKVYIARTLEQLKQSLPADVRVRLQLLLEQARADLVQASGANTATLREAALARVSLTLTTQQAAAPVKKGGTGRFERAARDAGSFLAGAGAIVVFLLIVLSPLVVLVAAGLLGVRAYRRREERRLLASA
jgi:Domain of unknown function (DUF4349)